VNRLGDPHVLALAVRRLAGSCALLSLGFLVGRASASGGLMAALASCPGWTAKVVVVAGASGKGVSSASAARVADGVPGTTNQRASASDPTAGLGVAGLGVAAGLGGTSSSIATGTSGSGGFALAATTGCGASTRVAGPVVSAVAAGQNASAVTERIAAIANNKAKTSHMMVCFIAASPRPIEQKIRRILNSGTALGSFKINSGWLEAD
jgi:hypothetical protein